MLDYLQHRYHVIEHFFRERSKGTSKFWRDCRRDFLLEHPTCAACGGTEHLGVHHIEPFYLHPSKEVDWTNLITLCMGPLECHRLLGHGSKWVSYCPTVRKDAEQVLKQPALRPLVEQYAKKTRIFRNPFA